jgi:hypothetical protein
MYKEEEQCEDELRSTCSENRPLMRPSSGGSLNAIQIRVVSFQKNNAAIRQAKEEEEEEKNQRMRQDGAPESGTKRRGGNPKNPKPQALNPKIVSWLVGWLVRYWIRYMTHGGKITAKCLT